MKLKSRKPLGLEALEDRWVPATVRFDGSNLIVSNPLITAGASTLTVIQQAGGGFKVTDGVANNGTYAVTGNITVLGNNAKDSLTVNVLAGSGLTGNLSVNAGNGADNVTVDSTAATGFIAGNTSINLGLGTNTVSVGGTVGLTEKGSVSVSSRGAGASRLQVLGGAAAGAVLGSTTVAGFPTALFGLTQTIFGKAEDVFAGGVTVNNTSNSQVELILLAPTANDLGNFTVLGGQGNTIAVLQGGSVLGTAAFDLGNGNNSFGLSSAFTGKAITVGNFIYNGGNGSNNFAAVGAAGTDNVLGNVVLNAGNGANALNAFGIGVTTALTVQGNMSVNVGNGSLDGTTFTFQAVVDGNLNVNTGNGNNSFTLDGVGGAVLGGSFNYTGGNGGNNVTVTTTAANSVTLNVHMGNNPGTGVAATSNVFTIGAAAPGTLTGNVGWGIPSSAAMGNAFNDGGYVWSNSVTLTNVPS